MNVFSETDAANARRREDVLRELNLYPLWRLRSAPASAPAPVITEAPDIAATLAAKVATPLANASVALRAEQDVGSDMPVADTDKLGWLELKMRVQACTACKLRAGCTQTVFGSGDEDADWLFVGSWPTEDDDAKGEPFAGQAGQLLDNMLTAIKLKRGSNVYLANVVKCSGSLKRGPQADEIALCSPYLARQIQLLQPKMIVALGHAAATALLGEDREWSSLPGSVHGYRGFAKDTSQAAIPLIITHHPAALLLVPLNKAQTWQDLCLARDTMRSLLSGKEHHAGN